MKKPWQEYEQAAVLRLYETGGPAAVQAEIPHRSQTEIRSWASRHKLRWRNGAIKPAIEARLEEVYRAEGFAGVRREFPHLTRNMVGGWAQRKGVKVTPRPKKAKAKRKPVEWRPPSQDMLQRLDCIRFRKWRGPVNAGPLVATIGRRAA